MSTTLDASIRDADGQPVGVIPLTGTDLARVDFDAVLREAQEDAVDDREWDVRDR